MGEFVCGDSSIDKTQHDITYSQAKSCTQHDMMIALTLKQRAPHSMTG